jgi:hypothetical protein
MLNVTKSELTAIFALYVSDELKIILRVADLNKKYSTHRKQLRRCMPVTPRR